MEILEMWKEHPILGIRVSNLGRVETKIKGKHFGSYDKYGYKQVGWKGKVYKVHRLIYETFIGEIPKGYQVNHIDENKTNNRVDNLNIMTAKENLNWGTHNKRSADNRRNGDSQSKPVNQYTKDGKLVKTWLSNMEASRNGYDSGNISRCCNGKQYTYKGYIWKYKKDEA